ncbi:UDP-N-acetylglucosamine--undecaprenyl-phosphate N-acetylglucosaminephosphotransferase [Candidatus Palibaumannia cicadellinicola]|uniref:Undecaprenyl-phosphate alpha-N-acetylglucosaminyl 1-phosphate transferase n=1 Tax=Candidatus Palibaumannia cicadellinicola TaxID=186490 RepID=A0A088MY08_9GAMM|nr:UDP-N-acetylglucosamine--undecaprenyl-phosphate N-acetylglucosaminephosphotransferase [Candidatus Baumannia cicadellinicola]AIN47099.1 Undecaprenyl-phosphate N-acetylglucosaminyl 1-phosphate transferase [Candidatus Baumannia cicadellinicola]
MNILKISTDFVKIFIFSLLFLFFVRKVAKKVGLVDKPNSRKCHQGQIPLVGGISIYAGICFTFLYIYNNHGIPHMVLYLICAAVLVITGVIDDRFEINVITRAIIQALVAVAMMIFSGSYIKSFGYIFGPWEMVLGPFGYLVTLFSFWAAINAFNMVDGIDGLLGGLSCVSLGAMGILLYIDNNQSLALCCFAMITAIFPYILLNIGVCGRRYKVFMGDAGSTMIGFTITWLLLQSTQGLEHPITPVTALWVIAVPLMDMVAIMYRRIRKGMSPFAPDRQHIHHLIMRAGFTSSQAFIIITLIAGFLAFVGVIGERWLCWSESVMLLLWMGIFLLYGHIVKCAWYVIRFVKRNKKRLSHTP